MRCLLLAFSLGIVILQQQARALTFTFDKGASHAPRREGAHDARYWWDAPVEGEFASLD
jgi:hypothetical protein